MEYLKEVSIEQVKENKYLKLLLESMSSIEERAVVTENGKIEELNYTGELRCLIKSLLNENKEIITEIAPIVTGENEKKIIYYKNGKM